MTQPAILIVEHDTALRLRLRRALRAEGWDVVDVPDGGQAASAASADLVVVGSSPRGAAGSLDLARHVRRSGDGTPVIFLAIESSEPLAISALRAGVSDYFSHPVPLDELTASIRRCLGGRATGGGVSGRRRLEAGAHMIGGSARMREIQAYIEQVAATDSTVLITGETGTGKELTAALIHQWSRRRHKPLVHINCAAIPDTLLESELFGYERGAFTGASAPSAGKLQAGDGGSVLLDEIGDMSVYAQAKILRLIESKEIERLGGRRSAPVDVRVLAATNQDLERLMAEGRFRKDLYYRLNVARIELPPLRERKEDMPALLHHYIRDFARLRGRDVDGIDQDALAALVRHDWPGNVRELRNVVEMMFATVRSGCITLGDVPPAYRQARAGRDASVPEDERDRLLAALSATKWNKSKAAARLHWSRMTVYRKMAKYRLLEGGKHVPGREPRGDDRAGSPRSVSLERRDIA